MYTREVTVTQLDSLYYCQATCLQCEKGAKNINMKNNFKSTSMYKGLIRRGWKVSGKQGALKAVKDGIIITATCISDLRFFSRLEKFYRMDIEQMIFGSELEKALASRKR